mgnify:CR=1 FL=1
MGLYPSKTSIITVDNVASGQYYYEDDGSTLTVPPKTTQQEVMETLQYETCKNLTSNRLLDDLGM